MTTSAFMLDSESQLRGLIDAIQEFIVLKDGQGRWLITNRIVIDTYRLQGVDYVGKTDMELALIRPEFHEAFVYNVQTDEQAWQKGSALRIQKSFMGLDGHLNTWEVIKTPSFDEAGNRHQLVIVSRNITERRLAEQAQSYQAIKDTVRKEQAIDWLADPSMTYSDIATQLGFADISAFYKAFRKWTGTNPGHYRNLILAQADSA